MPTEEQLEGFARAARAYAAGRARQGVEVSAKEVYDRAVATEVELERRRSEKGGR